MDYKSLGFEVKASDKEEMKFAGFASTPDLDQGGDIIVKGAWGRTLAERGAKVKMLWGHKSDLMPLGRFTMIEERESGLYVEGKISDTAQGRDAMTLMRDGAIDSMSIGYIAKESDYRDDGVRVIKDLDLFEVSLVNFPMNEKAIITSVKNLDVREVERVLREAGLSRSQAKAIASKGVSGLREVGDKEKEALEEIKSAIENFNQTLRGYSHGN